MTTEATKTVRESDNDFLNNTMPTPPKEKGTVYVICAAIWIKDGKEYIHQPRNIDSGFVIGGRRHHNCLITLKELDKHKRLEAIENGTGIDQGFITSDDRFVNREEAGIIAYNAGQTKKLEECLFSEHLY